MTDELLRGRKQEVDSHTPQAEGRGHTRACGEKEHNVLCVAGLRQRAGGGEGEQQGTPQVESEKRDQDLRPSCCKLRTSTCT